MAVASQDEFQQVLAQLNAVAKDYDPSPGLDGHRSRIKIMEKAKTLTRSLIAPADMGWNHCFNVSWRTHLSSERRADMEFTDGRTSRSEDYAKGQSFRGNPRRWIDIVTRPCKSDWCSGLDARYTKSTASYPVQANVIDRMLRVLGKSHCRLHRCVLLTLDLLTFPSWFGIRRPRTTRRRPLPSHQILQSISAESWSGQVLPSDVNTLFSLLRSHGFHFHRP